MINQKTNTHTNKKPSRYEQTTLIIFFPFVEFFHNIALKAKVYINFSKEKNQDNKLIIEIENAETNFLIPTDEPYYFGSVFLHVLSKYLGESEAIKVVINPFKIGINPELELSSVPNDENLFQITIDDMNSSPT